MSRATRTESPLAVPGERQGERPGPVLARRPAEGEQRDDLIPVPGIDARRPGGQGMFHGEKAAHPLEGPALAPGGGRVLPAEAGQEHAEPPPFRG